MDIEEHIEHDEESSLDNQAGEYRIPTSFYTCTVLVCLGPAHGWYSVLGGGDCLGDGRLSKAFSISYTFALDKAIDV